MKAAASTNSVWGCLKYLRRFEAVRSCFRQREVLSCRRTPASRCALVKLNSRLDSGVRRNDDRMRVDFDSDAEKFGLPARLLNSASLDKRARLLVLNPNERPPDDSAKRSIIGDLHA